MHEISLVRDVFRTLEAEYGPEAMARMQEIKMRIGQLANIEPILMQNAFWAVKQDQPQYDHVQLSVEMLPVLVKCDACEAQSTITNYTFVCAHCGAPTKNIIQGTELLIHQVTFAQEPLHPTT